jgi:hypothetical protein
MAPERVWISRAGSSTYTALISIAQGIVSAYPASWFGMVDLILV